MSVYLTLITQSHIYFEIKLKESKQLTKFLLHLFFIEFLIFVT